MANYEYLGCVTGFSEAGNTQLIQPTDTPMPVTRASNAYTERLLGVGLLVGGGDGFCQVKASAWSNPITFEMVNKPSSIGGVTVDFGGYNYGIDLSEISTTVEFFEALNQEIHGADGYKIGIQANIDSSVLVRFEEYTDLGTKEELAEYVEQRTVFYKNVSGFYVYDSSNIGNNAESVIYLANAFSETPEFVYCDLPRVIGE